MATFLTSNEIESVTESYIAEFHNRRAESLQNLELSEILGRKSPYFYMANKAISSGGLVKLLLDEYLFSVEEVAFGELLEGLAIFVCGRAFNGRKSSAEGIDLEFERDGLTYIVAVKSGPNWGNSSQIKRMIDNFKKAQRILRTSSNTGSPHANIRAVNGCCYGQENQTDKGDYLKLCGQEFWEFISGDEQLYMNIIEPLGYKARERNDKFAQDYARILNLFTNQFFLDFCVDGAIDWQKLVQFNSGSTRF